MEGNVTTIVAIGAFALLAIVVTLLKEAKLRDPGNHRVVSVDDLGDGILLPAGPVGAVLFRQSGGHYRDLGVFAAPDAAISEVRKSLKRARIDSIAVLKNDEAEYRVVRLHHNARGRSQGKKLGGASIFAVRIEREDA